MAQRTQKPKGMVGISSYNHDQWLKVDPIIPSGVPIAVLDQHKLVIGTGKKYSESDFEFSRTLTDAQLALIEEAGKANGVVVLDENGKVPVEYMPASVQGSIQYVADIAARDALPVDKRDGLIIVFDASGDVNVTKDSATYIYQDLPGDPEQKEWLMISEYESLNLDLTPYFNVNTDDLSRIADGGGFKKLTDAKDAKLDTIEENADVTDEENVRAAGALMSDDIIFIQPLTAEEMKFVTEPAPVVDGGSDV